MLDADDIARIKEIVVDPLADKMDTVSAAQAEYIGDVHTTVKGIGKDVAENTKAIAVINQRCEDRAEQYEHNACLPVRILRWFGGLLFRGG